MKAMAYGKPCGLPDVPQTPIAPATARDKEKGKADFKLLGPAAFMATAMRFHPIR
jgi:hypothetical protein